MAKNKILNKEQEQYMIELKSDFKKFYYVTSRFMNMNDPTYMQYDIADYLQNEVSGRDRMVQAPRAEGKTMILISYVCWRFLNDSNYKILYISATQKFVETISKAIMTLISTMPELRHLDPFASDLSSVTSFNVNGPKDIDKSPSFRAVGISGQITGSRADEIIADDIEISTNSRTQTMRQSIIEGKKEFINVRKSDGKSKITYVGTPQTEDTIYKTLSNTNIRIWTARYPELNKIKNYKGNLAPWIEKEVTENPKLVGVPTDPGQQSHEELTLKELAEGWSNFVLQYMLDHSLTDEERYPLKLSDFIVYGLSTDKAPKTISYGKNKDNIRDDLPNVGFMNDNYYGPLFVDEEWTEYENAIMSIDPSGKGKDETAYTVIKQLHGTLFILEVGSVNNGFDDESLHEIAKIAKKHSVNEIVIESNAIGEGYIKALSRVTKYFYNVGITGVHNSKNKELRIINTLEPMMNAHKIVINESIITEDSKKVVNGKSYYQLMHQISRITKDKNSLLHDDKVDALALGVEYFIDILELTDEEGLQAFKDAEWQKRMAHYYGEEETNLNYLDSF